MDGTEFHIEPANGFLRQPLVGKLGCPSRRDSFSDCCDCLVARQRSGPKLDRWLAVNETICHCNADDDDAGCDLVFHTPLIARLALIGRGDFKLTHYQLFPALSYKTRLMLG